MPDDVKVVPQTDPTAKGTSTSEFKFAAAVAVVGGLLGGIDSAVMILRNAYPNAWWVPLVSGLVAMLGAAGAYLRNRSTVKVAMLESGTQVALSRQITSLEAKKVEAVLTNP